jgi:hypothetical protein
LPARPSSSTQLVKLNISWKSKGRRELRGPTKEPERRRATHDIERITDRFLTDPLERMTSSKSVQQRSLPVFSSSRRHLGNVSMKLGESTGRLVDRPDTEDLKTFLGERTGLVETDNVDLSSDVDTVRRDAEDAGLTKTVDGEGRSDRESGRKSRRNNNGDEIEGSNEDGVPFDL